MLMTRIKEYLTREDGTISVEAVLIFPMLTWCYLATFVYFDGFKTQTNNLKAAYTISDMLSRETGFVTPEYMDSLYLLHEFLTTSNHDTDIRVTMYDWVEDDNEYIVRWSQFRGDVGDLDTTELNTLSAQLPVMPENESYILVQTWVTYEPAFSVGLDAFHFQNLITTRPRFASQLCWNTENDGNLSTATC